MEEQEKKTGTSCAFTGHRPEFLPWGRREDDPRCAQIKEELRQAVERAYDEGCRHFICGMARGGDFYFAEAVLKLKEGKADITLEAAIPHPEQAKGWSAEDRERYRRILERCEVETLVQQSYTPDCLMRRNQYMVEHAQRLIALYNGRCRGGTYATINFALDKKRTLDILYL